MDKQSESRYSMNIGVTNYLQEQSAVFSPLPGYPPLLTQLLANNAEVATVGQAQGINRSGLTDQKTRYRQALAAISFKVGNLVEVYAKMSDNLKLAKEVHVSQSGLIRLPDTILYEHASSILSIANENATELATYGVTSAMVDELEAAISAFYDSIPKPAAGKSLTKQATKRIKELLDDNEAILEKVDLLSQIFRFTNPEAYGNYHNLRKVVETGKRYIAFKAKVTDASTNLPLSNVLFQFNSQPGTIYPVGVPVPVPLTKKSAEKGGFQIKNMIAGDYQVTVSKNGYHPQNLTAYVNDGEMATLNVALIPTGA